jgi:hypothetical protein
VDLENEVMEYRVLQRFCFEGDCVCHDLIHHLF